ncbi:hypothetical protein JF550_14155 [Microbacterium esteraromaticum]|uniref:Anti-bacteriophage protein A/HamA C-terminal domain-containing protein n=1 Tax=Microbacterium esteraromaticum TaxID=57043 RepID=A0A939DY80_9MICO|nr:hypothetical protein [Microbacterium esteraromaticum]MBN8207091.1 hypothetical protein [Microbacterium esteraromaticum]MBN8417245.1 hypothetical protein [Microbacterium esteraromaticum]
MEGMEVDRLGAGTLVIVRDISDEFRSHIRERLAAYCYGATVVSEDASFYSFEKTVAEFMRRYDPKPHATKIGMAGELVVHVLMPLLHEELISSAVYFNKEERSIKKGFDLTFLGADDSEIWYGEVKSGEVTAGDSADEKAAALIDIAASSLVSMLSDRELLSRWDAALIDTRLTLDGGYARSARNLLRSDSETVRSGGHVVKRALLAGAVMHELGHCVVTSAGVEEIVAAVEASGEFVKSRVLVIQQSALEAVIEHLRELASA